SRLSALELAFVGAGHKISKLRFFQCNQIFESLTRLIEVVDQALAEVWIVLQEPFQAGLFEYHSVVDALSSLAIGAGFGMTPDGFMIGFGPPGKCREQIVGNHAEIQLIKAAAAIGFEEGG